MIKIGDQNKENWMDIRATTEGKTAIIHMSGRFDFNVHRDFKGAYDPLLQQKDINSLEIDLSGVEYLDSSALGMLLLLRERAAAEGKEVVLCKPGSTVLQILDIANFAKLFTIR
jgi:anti-anti-sigma factor